MHYLLCVLGRRSTCRATAQPRAGLWSDTCSMGPLRIPPRRSFWTTSTHECQGRTGRHTARVATSPEMPITPTDMHVHQVKRTASTCSSPRCWWVVWLLGRLHFVAHPISAPGSQDMSCMTPVWTRRKILPSLWYLTAASVIPITWSSTKQCLTQSKSLSEISCFLDCYVRVEGHSAQDKDQMHWMLVLTESWMYRVILHTDVFRVFFFFFYPP